MFNLFKNNIPKPIPTGVKPVILLILDGFGVAPASEGNAISRASTPNYNKFLRTFPNGELIASGESVGIPANEEGNSEVGHLTLGAGRPVLQSLMRVNKAIEDMSFYDNPAFISAREHTRRYGSRLHIMGLVSSGMVHASMEHLYALLDFCKKRAVSKIFLHLFTDGRDAPPNEAKQIVESILENTKPLPSIQIATISGRYFAMDRDRRWERTQKAYDAIVLGKGMPVSSPLEAIESAYAKGLSDEFIVPSVITNTQGPVGTVNDNDAVIFFNFRIDRPRQLSMAFTMPNFERLEEFDLGFDPHHEEGKPTPRQNIVSGPTFKRERWPQNLFFVTMTEYQKNIPVGAIAFPPLTVDDSLTRILADNNIKQLHLAESEKERMVTYYFDGMKEQCYIGEDVLIVPSPKVSTYDKKPEMSIRKIVSEFVKALNKGIYQFYVINFANPDMVGHSGNIEASIKAVEATDWGIGQIVGAALSVGGTTLITADHGNVEELIKYPTGSYFFTTSEGDTDTAHSNNPVPLLIISSQFQGKPLSLPKGSLADVAPTILSIMNIRIPDSMMGTSLSEKLKGI